MAFPQIICDSHPRWVALYQYAASLVMENLDSTEYRPGWLPNMTCMPGIGRTWQWDSCFMAVYAKYLNGMAAPMNNLDNLYSLQREDGYISMAYDIADGKPAFGERINPPLFAWCEWEYYRFSGDLERVKRVLGGLIKYFNWLKDHRRRENGLYFFEDTGSSGMDNSPRSGYPAKHLDGSDLCWVDLICQQLLSARCIARLAHAAGNEAVQKMFETEAAGLAELITQHHYRDNAGFYFDVFYPTGNALANKTVAGFWPLLSQAADPRQTAALLKHLNDPDEFNTPHPVPSLSRDDPNYVPGGGYWLGGVWPPTFYMVVKGLDVNGFPGIARDLSARHLDMMCQVLENPAYNSIWECYSPEYPTPATRGKTPDEAGVLVRDRFVGWGALGPVAMFIEDILGLDFCGAENTVFWRISQTGRHGIADFNFAGKTVSLICSGRAPANKTIVVVKTDKAFTLALLVDGRSDNEYQRFEVPAGGGEFLI